MRRNKEIKGRCKRVCVRNIDSQIDEYDSSNNIYGEIKCNKKRGIKGNTISGGHSKTLVP